MPANRPLHFLLIATVIALVAGCGTVKNTIVDGDDQALMLRGSDPVAYFTEAKPVKGNPAIKADYNGITYRFASDANKAAFVANPKKYEPQYAGFCASGAPYALKASIGADTFAIVDDKLCLYGGLRSRQGWMLDAIYAQRKAAGTLNPLAAKYGV